MKIQLPEGYVMPDGVKPGEDFEAVATLTIGEDGQATLTAIDGIDLDDESEEMEDEEGMDEETPEGGKGGMAVAVKIPWADEEG